MADDDSQPLPESLRQVFINAVNNDNENEPLAQEVSLSHSADFFDFFWIFYEFLF